MAVIQAIFVACYTENIQAYHMYSYLNICHSAHIFSFFVVTLI